MNQAIIIIGQVIITLKMLLRIWSMKLNLPWKSLAEKKIKNKIEQLLLKHKQGNDIHEHWKQHKAHKFVLNLSQGLDLRSLNKHVSLQTLPVYYTWKNVRKQGKNNKLKTITPTWNDEFELPNGYSVSYIQGFIEYIMKKHKTFTAISPIHVYINRVNHKLVFTIKDEYKLELLTPETMKLFDSTKKLIDKPKNGENMLSLEGGEVVLV